MTTRHIIPLPALFLCLFFATQVPAQSDSASKPGYKNTLAITPLRLFIVSNIGPELVYQRKLSDQFSIQGKAGWVYKHRMLLSTLAREAKGGRLGLEAKWFYNKAFQRGTYNAVELEGGFIERVETWDRVEYSLRYTPYIVRTSYGSLSLKVGYQRIKGRFFFDVFSGIGLRPVNVKYPGISDQEYEYMFRGRDPMELRTFALTYSLPARGTYWSLVILLNMRLGFAF